MRHSEKEKEEKMYLLGRTIAENIRNKRIEKGWDIEDMVFYTGLSERTITNLEAGCCNPEIKTLLHLSMAIGCPLSELISI